MPGVEISRRIHAKDAPSTSPPYVLGDFCIDEYRPVKVIVIGAGFSGITAGIRYASSLITLGCSVQLEERRRFPQKVPNVELVIYEKGARIGGTWHNNNYPCVYPGS